MKKIMMFVFGLEILIFCLFIFEICMCLIDNNCTTNYEYFEKHSNLCKKVWEKE